MKGGAHEQGRSGAVMTLPGIGVEAFLRDSGSPERHETLNLKGNGFRVYRFYRVYGVYGVYGVYRVYRVYWV